MAQSADQASLTNQQYQYEQVYLDGMLAYRNVINSEIITLDAFNALGIAPEVKPSLAIDLGHWDTTRVNAYRHERLISPFAVRFDQLTYTPPVEDGMVITSRFGRRNRGPHKGIDVDLVTGDEVKSILPGVVRFVGYSRGHGKTVVVRHANEVETVYAHLSKYNVSINDVVSEGQSLGKGGTTGNARGSHLHFEIRYKGQCIHPEYLLSFDGDNQIRGHELWVTSDWRNPHNHSSYSQSKIELLTNQDEALAAQIAAPKYHRVRKGDTLYRIARTYNVRLSEICSMNSINASSVLHVGKTIKVR